MTKLMPALKEEIIRIARKSIRSALAGLNKDRKALKKTVSSLKKEIPAIQRSIKALSHLVPKNTVAMPEPVVDDGQRVRITGKGIRSLRRKLKLTQAELGKLMNITEITMGNLERKNGPVNMHTKTRSAYLAVRSLGAREARARLGG